MPLTVVALGGNAIASPAGLTESCPGFLMSPIAQTSSVLADAILAGHGLVITHGNGPQVGDLLVQSEAARDVVPPVSLDWCVAQTQATIGIQLASAIETSLRTAGVPSTVVPLLTRVLVDPYDPGFGAPTKPIGPWQAEHVARTMPIPAHHGRIEVKDRGWRRVVPSPRPVSIVDTGAIDMVLAGGGIVIACGGGGVPVVAQGLGYRGVEAVIDKDLTAVLLARHVGTSRLAILTDVEGAALDFGTSRQRFLGSIDIAHLRRHLEARQFGVGSMESKVIAAIDFVDSTGGQASIGALQNAREVLAGRSGTRVARQAAA